jgi:hypothetical protein
MPRRPKASEEFSLTFLAIVKAGGTRGSADSRAGRNAAQRPSRGEPALGSVHPGQSVRWSLPIAAGLVWGATACAAGGTGATTTTAATVGEGTDASDDAASTSITGTDTSGATSSTSGSTGGDSDESGSTDDGGSSSDTGVLDACAGELETFAIDPVWTAIGFPDDGNAYGWVAGGAQSGGDPGEIGGTFQRSGTRTVFADAITPTSADDCIAAQGRLVIPRVEGSFNSYVQFGHFPLAAGTGVGFAFSEGSDNTVRVFMISGGADELAFMLDAPGVALEWSYSFDPSTAMMTLTLEGYGSLSRPVTPEIAMALVGLDAFGIHHEPHDNANDSPGVLEVYLDEIAYTR